MYLDPCTSTRTSACEAVSGTAETLGRGSPQHAAIDGGLGLFKSTDWLHYGSDGCDIPTRIGHRRV